MRPANEPVHPTLLQRMPARVCGVYATNLLFDLS
ncbi:UNVERIFIED_ORG: hypothetical protein HNP28_000964 [Comamonas terrigena]